MFRAKSEVAQTCIFSPIEFSLYMKLSHVMLTFKTNKGLHDSTEGERFSYCPHGADTMTEYVSALLVDLPDCSWRF